MKSERIELRILRHSFSHQNFLFTFATVGVTEAVTYENGCSCGLDRGCIAQASFIKFNSSETVPVQGLKIGCTPTESLLASTLECFYHVSCIYLIEEQMNYSSSINTNTDPPIPLSSATSRFSTNTTVDTLVSDLFTENWTVSTNYSSYYEWCSPSLCLYTYTQELSSLYTITLLISFYSTLSIILQWVCPRIILVIFKIYLWRKKSTVTIEPSRSVELSSTAPATHTTVHHGVDLKSGSSMPTIQ